MKRSPFESAKLRTVFLLGIAVAAAACGAGGGYDDGPDASGDGDASDAPLDGDASSCTPLELGRRDLQLNLVGQLTGVRYPVTPGIDGGTIDWLLVELYDSDSTTEGLPPLEPGTFELGVAPNDDLATCQHCVWLPVDWDGESPFGTIFVAVSGRLNLTRVTDPLELSFAGSIVDVELREATIDEAGRTHLVEGGRCLLAPDTSFDTEPTPGRACLSAEDCGNPLLEVCSPSTYTCGEIECGEFFGCPAERPLCLSQYPSRALEGACYEMCDPTSPGGCADGEVCLQIAVDPRFGFCTRSGDGALGESCTVEDTSSSCTPGHFCSWDTLTCTRSCAFFAADPGCQSGAQCTVLGECAPAPSGVDVPFGAACGEEAALAQGCAPDGTAFRGMCFAFREDDPLICEEACLGELGCEPGEFCALRFTSGLGICLPDPVCGDGRLGEIGEVCDDGNTVSDDGCSADCRTVEYDAICGGLPSLALDGSVAGDTRDAWDGFQASCQAGIARAEIFRLSPPSRGRLRLIVDSPTIHVMSLRTACAEAGSESACGNSAGIWGAPELVYQVVDPSAELTVLVSAFTVLEEGPFTLHVEFAAEACGDGVIAGLERCDDGNTVSGDGCSADCRTVEYDVYCAAATELTAATPAEGDNSDGPFVFEASCSNTLFGSGRDVLYRYIAPASGTLHLQLDPGDADLTLAVFDGCGAPGFFAELGCSSVYGPEQVDLEVEAGQVVTILVEGFGAEDAGPFTLTAQLVR
ncbi:MAG: DUF4215 domain-containing protein [Acidobacteria bacterium]|nr:DUF4215 domain-containing protein [Acidobacteriota bacterium]